MSISPPAASLSQLNQPQHLLDAYARQLYRVAEHAEMVASRAAWVKVGRLKHRADSPSSSGKVCVWLAEDKRPAARRRREAEQHPQRRRLAGAVRPQKARNRARLERKGEIVDSDESPEPLRQRLGNERRRHLPSVTTRDSRPRRVPDSTPSVFNKAAGARLRQ